MTKTFITIRVTDSEGRSDAFTYELSVGVGQERQTIEARGGSVVIDIFEKHIMDEYSAKLCSYLIDKFKKSLEVTQGIVDIRGKGLMIGIELEKDRPNLVEKALENKLLINVTSGKVIRLLPPLIMNEKEADQVVSILTSILKKYLSLIHI